MRLRACILAFVLSLVVHQGCEKKRSRPAPPRPAVVAPAGGAAGPQLRWEPVNPSPGDVVRIFHQPRLPGQTQATSVVLQWTVNHGDLPPAELRPPGTTVSPHGRAVDTPMQLAGDTWVTSLTTNAHVSCIDFAFRMGKDASPKAPSSIRLSNYAALQASAQRLHQSVLAKNWDAALSGLEKLAADRAVDRKTRATVRADLAQTYHALGLMDDMEKALKQMPSELPGDALWQNDAAWAMATAKSPGVGHLRAAEILSKNAVEIATANSMYLDTYAWVLTQLNQHDQAIAMQKKAIECGGNDRGYYYRYAVILANAGKKQEAVEAYGQGMRSGPGQNDARFRAMADSLLGPVSAQSKVVIPSANLKIPDDLTSCAANLRKIKAALDKYQKDKGKQPDWLSDLVPNYLTTETLLCPIKPVPRSQFYADPKFPCSYTYEFNPKGRDNRIRQMGSFGDVVPIVRCYTHGPVTSPDYKVLNVALNGQVYWSRRSWESLFPVYAAPTPQFGSPGAPPTATGSEPAYKPRADEGTIVAFDGFDGGQLKLAWKTPNSDPTHFSLTRIPGTLTITTQNGGFAGLEKNYRNVFLIDCPATPGTDLLVTTCLSSFRPVAGRNQAGLIFWNDEDNYFKWDYEADAEGRLLLAAARETEGRFLASSYEGNTGGGKVWLSITKRDNRYEVSISLNGRFFRSHDIFPWGDGAVKQVGLFAKNGAGSQAPEIDASFDFFEVRALRAQPAGTRVQILP